MDKILYKLQMLDERGLATEDMKEILNLNRVIFDSSIVGYFFLTTSLCLIMSPLLDKYTEVVLPSSIISLMISVIFLIRCINYKGKLRRKIVRFI